MCVNSDKGQSSDYTYIFEDKVSIDKVPSDVIYGKVSNLFVPLKGAAPVPDMCRDEATALLKPPFQNLVIASITTVTSDIPLVTGGMLTSILRKADGSVSYLSTEDGSEMFLYS